MIPLLMKIKIPRKQNTDMNVYLPLFLIWFILILLVLLLLPVVLVAGLLTWHRGGGRILVYFYPMFFSVLWHLGGLLIEVEHKDNRIFISFI
jgi:hypothetical protein